MDDKIIFVLTVAGLLVAGGAYAQERRAEAGHPGGFTEEGRQAMRGRRGVGNGNPGMGQQQRGQFPGDGQTRGGMEMGQ